MTFSLEDAHRPFLTVNDRMWDVFEPELRRRLAELQDDAATAERVRSALLDGLPGGQGAMDDVARRLGMSKRSLQRHLRREGTSFQDLLRITRRALAEHYLERTRYTPAEISFLLGFSEPNSFFRAFRAWTDTTPEAWRRARRAAADEPGPELGI